MGFRFQALPSWAGQGFRLFFCLWPGYPPFGTVITTILLVQAHQVDVIFCQKKDHDPVVGGGCGAIGLVTVQARVQGSPLMLEKGSCVTMRRIYFAIFG